MPRISLARDAPHDMPKERVKSVNDILDWLSSVFGFQVTLNSSLLFLFYICICCDIGFGSYVGGPLYLVCMHSYQRTLNFLKDLQSLILISLKKLLGGFIFCNYGGNLNRIIIVSEASKP